MWVTKSMHSTYLGLSKGLLSYPVTAEYHIVGRPLGTFGLSRFFSSRVKDDDIPLRYRASVGDGAYLFPVKVHMT